MKRRVGWACWTAVVALTSSAIASAAPDASAELDAARASLDASRSSVVHFHDGFFLRMGWGGAHLWSRGRGDGSLHACDVDPQACDVDPQASSSRSTVLGKSGVGIAASFEIGGAPLPGLLLGMSLMSHIFAKPKTAEAGEPSPDSFDLLGDRYVSFGGLVLFYPDPKGGLSSGLTVSTMMLNDEGEPSGIALAPQLGYGVWAGEQWSVDIFLRVTFARLSADSGTRANVALTTIGLALTYQ